MHKLSKKYIPIPAQLCTKQQLGGQDSYMVINKVGKQKHEIMYILSDFCLLIFL